MAEKDAPEEAPREADGPSLELPSFGFRRKKKRAPTEPPPPPAVAPREPVAEPAPAPPPAPQPTAPAPPPEPVPAPAPTRTTAPASARAAEQAPVATEEPTEPARTGPTLPQLGVTPATLLTGLLVGAVTVGLVWASQQGCELVRGTSSCGNGGFLVLVAILVVAGWLGGALLRGFGIAEGGSTSFLAMGLVAVVLMLVLGDRLFAWWMAVAVPLVAALAYLLSHRVTTSMVEPGGREMHR